MIHAYPQQLAQFVFERWNNAAEFENKINLKHHLPALPLLEKILSTIYQTSLLREESRFLTFRLILANSETFPASASPPDGLHRLVFTELRPFTQQELRRLAPAAVFHRSLIGLMIDETESIKIWGILQSGPRWLQSSLGGRQTAAKLPPELVISVHGAGDLEVCRGTTAIARLTGGIVNERSLNVFESKWLPASFAGIRAEIMELHYAAKAEEEKKGKNWANLDPDLSRIIAQHMIKRLISTARAAKHGGTIVIVPPDYAEEIVSNKRFLNLKYKFVEEEPRARFRTLILRIINRLAAIRWHHADERKISWAEYQRTQDETIADLDEAIFEVSHLIAGMSAVDGAVVITKRFEILGFAGEIGGDLEDVKIVRRACDIEGENCQTETTEGVGTRHRSAYRLCNAIRDAIAIVISQDGGVRFVKWNNGLVTHWDYVATGLLES